MRDPEQAQPPVGGFSELAHGRGAVHGMPVEDEEHRPGDVVQETLASSTK